MKAAPKATGWLFRYGFKSLRNVVGQRKQVFDVVGKEMELPFHHIASSLFEVRKLVQRIW